MNRTSDQIREEIDRMQGQIHALRDEMRRLYQQECEAMRNRNGSNASPIDRGRGHCVHQTSLNEHCRDCEGENATDAGGVT